MKNTIKTIIVFIMIIDVLGFISWKVSNQLPQDKYYAGIITNTIIDKLTD